MFSYIFQGLYLMFDEVPTDDTYKFSVGQYASSFSMN